MAAAIGAGTRAAAAGAVAMPLQHLMVHCLGKETGRGRGTGVCGRKAPAGRLLCAAA